MKRISVLTVVCIAMLALPGAGTALAKALVLKEAGTPLSVGSLVTTEILVDRCHVASTLAIESNDAHKDIVGPERPDEELCASGEIEAAVGTAVLATNGVASVELPVDIIWENIGVCTYYLNHMVGRFAVGGQARINGTVKRSSHIHSHYCVRSYTFSVEVVIRGADGLPLETTIVK